IHTGVDATAEDYLHDAEANPNPENIPDGVALYRVSGPFFFGVASKMADAFHRFDKPPKVLVLRLRSVPTIDATGLHMLEQVFEKCKKQNTRLMLAGAQPQVKKALHDMGLADAIGPENMLPNTAAALKRAKKLLAE